MVKAGSLKPLAVVSEKRLPEYPDVPTMAEVGYPKVGTLHWQSMLAPAATPKDVIETLHKAIGQAVESPAGAGGFQEAADPGNPERFAGRGADVAARARSTSGRRSPAR